MTEMDWSAQKSYTLYPKGVYKVCLTKTPELTKAATGTEQYKWEARIVEPVRYAGKPITDYSAITPNSLWKIARLVNSFGVETGNLPKMEVTSSFFIRILHQCVNRTAMWYVDQEHGNNDRLRNVVKDWQADPDQEPVTFATGKDDQNIPDFLKG